MQQRYRSGRDPQPMRPPVPRDIPPPNVAGPLIARFVEEDTHEYLVGDPWSSRTAHVPKRRSSTEASSPEQRRRTSSERLLRWSLYALVGAVCGGIVGIALGVIVVLAALMRLTSLSSRLRRWRRRQRASGDQKTLPAEATRERMQLLAALGQGFLGILVGSAVLYVLLGLR
jgi:uncharacterized iron-regulated membrane protein